MHSRMPRFDPSEILRVLDAHDVEFVLIGGVAAALHGSDVVTFDLDVTPLTTYRNLANLSDALVDLKATLRVEGDPAGVAFKPDPALLERMAILNLVTRAGDLDVVIMPAGTLGYSDLQRGAARVAVDGVSILVANLADVIRTKEAANREKDRLVLPRLRRLLELQSAASRPEE
jgi:hypothetical protein